ncbi:DNA invertase Pin-like site-specific DNA recombinase [Clostridium acetobutylicum]|uniref:Site-specific recombinases, DNA invertase Pin homolog n=1 Tax=Clostridium acetobutylicum (strain ATCC 824 / DSM 792 / JCM 1419 / IAM 19013 / LMG 5710 / NBRC 13948 / NRRL B-527 / VKM B-1787 / 2291 / W) TaxID=272562 RepID=Q97HQ7_CLOAB|nr:MULTISPECIES: recombinase family protein [Clostridium]AAK79913.1 Site-specific recombinases, DNA invertase Pin homolog [Clostridium acetobutylicum ATCC 824]ADZ21005.1 Site-specific recombinase [Clostridium acetobutylicum EA 2018]AEI32090.1 site-specific recombinase [Clostridium acetobutylicum DSM 1731]AWV82210.1 recombinase family protein [Clostridium acetobutylicum]NOV88963.1 DNA invertase Pin-like site-specific DNA recombinase [Clostridium acetobutylicum]
MKVAIYSRKSKFTGKGDSIENQIEMCKNFITSKYNKKVEFLVYEDEGFSGGTINRPQFKKLIKDVELDKLDVLVCYRLDRISRNVSDFSNTLDTLQEHHVDFISISEQFDTSTPMGRAMVYIASVFAQLERETIAERVKDNMIEMAKNGRWTGGKIPLGFNSKRIKYIDENGLEREIPVLEINKEESKFVTSLYEKYLELGSLHKLEVYITQNEIKSRNGILFEKSSLKIILQNPIYVKSSYDVLKYLKNNEWKVYGNPDGAHSLLTYNKTEQTLRKGKHIKVDRPKEDRFAAISNILGFIEPELWLEVQKQFDKNRTSFPRLGKTHNALLTGKIKCGKCKKYMLIQHGRISKKTGEKAFYYVCSLKQKSHKKLCNNSNIRTDKIENLVLDSLKNFAKSKKEIMEALKRENNYKLKNNNSDIKLELNSALSERKKQIDRLTNALANGTGVEDILINKIKLIKKECIKIENKLSEIENNHEKSKSNKINLDIINSMLDSCKIIDTLSMQEQKRIIDTLIDNIYWFGENHKEGKISIEFLGSGMDATYKSHLYEAIDLDTNSNGKKAALLDTLQMPN